MKIITKISGMIMSHTNVLILTNEGPFAKRKQ